MDDLADLDWHTKPAAPTGASKSASSGYHFDALLRSMPSTQPQKCPPAQSSRPAPPQEDAFASLLPSFGEKHQKEPLHQVPRVSDDGLWRLDALESKMAQAPRVEDEDDLLADFRTPSQPAVTQPENHDTLDLLGDLGKPVPVPSSQPSQAPAVVKHPTSPPPHVVGQLVEMGFAPQDARRALAKTDSDLEQAVQLLVDSIPKTKAPASPQSGSKPPRPDTLSFQKQADQFYAQASLFGTSMLKNANALWDSTKAQARKTLNDARRDAQDSSAMGIASEFGRHAWRRWNASPKRPVDYDATPRWMLQKDEPKVPQKGNSEPDRVSAPAPQANLLEEQAPAPNRSTAKPVVVAPTPKPSPGMSAPPTRRIRSLPSEDDRAVARATEHKDRGNAHFYRGAYAEAEAEYTKALDALPPTSLWCVPLLNNRANVRLKNGDSDGTLSDCTASIELIVLPTMQDGMYRPSQDALPASHASLTLREAYAKSVSQRARAYEANEKWALAKQDWERLAQYERVEGSGVKSGEAHRRAACEGLTRCARILQPSPPKSSSTPTGSAASAAAAAASDAGVNRVRALRKAQDDEEAERLSLKDSVDARLAAWTRGRETNIRALLASIDDPKYGLIWDELCWSKINLHNLLTDAQVKRAYTKAIARLHPDKLSRSNTTIEQRMLAAGMFHTLNDAFHT